MTPDIQSPTDLAEQLLALLQAASDGCSEYQLIQQLRQQQSAHFDNLASDPQLALFQTHFLIFNALYLLRERLWQARSAHLQISPLCCQLLPYQAGSAELAEHDPLRDYYLDLQHLHSTRACDVEQLLASFWSRLQGGDEQRAALELFELSGQPMLDLARIKHRYRQLVSQHHPDRGGNTGRLQSINLAFEILQRYYR
ncbi:MAG: DNA-J related domain-containing protein [Pseudomonas sp.]|uniref:DNA-J related domain-containing protein n=1 Tax=Pseudomonas sp. TaxID=306 RepID=UPI002732456E|nr:DNA-J related domain-containing protein [Pseudomonas sp.]MDP3845369.1 DNA-J related domain-containing protein [Pseudomonas sp.]